MILHESNEQAINLYNNLTGTKDGKRFVSSLIHNGFPRNDLMWAVEVAVKEGIPEYVLIVDYRQWKEYAIPFYQDSQGKGITSLPDTHKQMIKDIDDALKYYQHLDVIYDDGTTSIMPIHTFHHASLLPPEIKKPWCICKQEHRFNEFFPQCGAYLLITDVSLQEPYRNVIAIVNNNTTEYWDSNNQRMSEVSQEEEQRLVQYEQMLKPEVVELVNTYKINENKTYKNMKKNVQRINESQLRAIVAESVKKVLKESHSMEIEAALQDICRASSLIRNKTEYTQEEDYEPDYEIGYNDAAYLHKWASEIEEQAGEWLRN